MEDPHLIEQNDCNAASFTLNDLPPKFSEERLNIHPLDVATGWMREE
jgi:hypothetical protein